MALTDKKVNEALLSGKGVTSAPDRLTGTAAENKAIFDRLIRAVVAQAVNPVIDELAGTSGAAAVGALGGNIQAALNLDKAHRENKSNPHEISPTQIGAETPTEAQAKANAALKSAKEYTDTKATGLDTQLQGHVKNKSNPHGVSPAQIGAETPTEAQAKANAAQAAAKGYTDTEVTAARAYAANLAEGVRREADTGIKEAKALINAHKGDTANPHGVRKDQIGLGKVDNTSDKEKPVSQAAWKELWARDNRMNSMDGKTQAANNAAREAAAIAKKAEAAADRAEVVAGEAKELAMGGYLVIDPTTGLLSDLQTVIFNIYNALRPGPITAGEYAVLHLTAAEYAAKRISAFDYSIRGAQLLRKGLNS